MALSLLSENTASSGGKLQPFVLLSSVLESQLLYVRKITKSVSLSLISGEGEGEGGSRRHDFTK